MVRGRIGLRRHVVTFQRHNGATDEAGNPTYANNGDWDKVAETFCEVIGGAGGETSRGDQTTAIGTVRFVTDWAAVRDVRQTDRAVYNTVRYGILDITDLEGDQREMVIDAKVES